GVDPRGHLLRPDDQHVPGRAGPHRVGGVGQRVAEARARGVEVVGARRDDAEPVRDRRGRVGYRDLGTAGGHDDEGDVGGGQAARRAAAFSRPATTAMSAPLSSGLAYRRLMMPTRLRIHSSLVSTRAARSSLVTTLAGWYPPNDMIRAPAAGGNEVKAVM